VARFRRRGRVRGPRRSTDWIAGVNGEFTGDFAIAQPSKDFILVDEIDLDEHGDRFTVVRVVGEVWFTHRLVALGGAVCVAWGIYITPIDLTGAVIGLGTGFPGDDDSENWLFRRITVLSGISPGAQCIAEYANAHIDVRVMRKMEGRMNLILQAQVVASFNGEALTAEGFANLRTLVKLH